MAKTNYIIPKWQNCAECGTHLSHPEGRGRASKYCSKSCKAKARKKKARGAPICEIDGCDRRSRAIGGGLCEMHYYRARRTGETGTARMIQGGHSNCQYCGKPTDGRMYCDSRCNARAARGHPRMRICPICKNQYDPISDGGRDRLVCSDECDRAKKDLAIALRRGKAGSRFDLIIPDDVFRSAGYRCQGCGIECKKQDGRNVSPDDAQLDHIIPISKGGTHTWGNVQLLCRTCNLRKAAKLPEWLDERQPVLQL